MIRPVHLVTTIAMLAVLASGTTVFAQGPGLGGPRGRGPGAPMGPMGPGIGLPLRELGLTEAQQQQIRQLGEQFRADTRTVVERARQAEEARREAVGAVPVDESRIRAVMLQLAEAQTELAVRQARFHSDVYALLTPDQQQQAQKLREEREARMKQRQERMRQRLQERTQRPQA